MRLDKFLVECGLGTRKEVREIILEGNIFVNELRAKSPHTIINEVKDEIFLNDEKLEYKEFRYYVLNKEEGYITALTDSRDRTVMELLPEWVILKDLFPVGRLDKDTEGLLLFTNNGKFAHQLISPKKHVDKIYYVELKDNITEKGMEDLKIGVDIGGYITMPAEVEKIEDKIIHLNIREGKFHQVKKMLQAVGNEVVYLKRIKFGKLELGNLEIGEVIEVNQDDII
ncbi:MAG: pseudouridine synthase [Fusobacteriaceae bacterium]